MARRRAIEESVENQASKMRQELLEEDLRRVRERREADQAALDSIIRSIQEKETLLLVRILSEAP